jgi:porin
MNVPRSRHLMRGAGALTLGLSVLVFANVASAQEDIPPTWGGSLADRPRLTGSWGGFRDEMGKKGISLDVDLNQVYQGVTTGGREQEGQYNGLATYTLNIDTQKAGLWPGGFFQVQGMTGFGNNVNDASGALTNPPNFVALLPVPGQETTGLTSLMYTQFLSEKFGVYLGQLNGLSADNNAFAHDYNNQFLNANLNINMILAMFPFFSYGGGIIALPTPGSQITASVIGATGSATQSVSNSFEDGAIAATLEGRVTVKPFGKVGHQLIGFAWSDQEHTSLEQDPTNIANLLLKERFPRLNDPGPLLQRILARFFPELLNPAQPPSTVSSTWALYYNFDQFVWNPEGHPDRGIGVFGRLGVSDGTANPIKYSFNLGIGGKGLIAGRPLDQCGIGWAGTTLSSNFVPLLRDRLQLGLHNENVIEAYYNAYLTRWMGAAVDFQYIDPALKKVLNSSNQLVDLEPSFVAGVRLYIRF